MNQILFFASFLPAFRRTCSPLYKTPLPLYGSGGLNERILDAINPTSSLLIPATFMFVLASTVTSTSFGNGRIIGWLKPKLKVTLSFAA